MKIIVSGPAAAFDSSDNQITNAAQLKKLDGLVASDGAVCSDFLDGDLDEIGLTGGAVKIAYDAASNRLRVVTEYRCHRKLQQSELDALADETQGQWSDGIGEGGFLDHAEQTGISVDPYPIRRDKHTVTIEQVDDGVKTPPPKRTSPLFKAIESGDIGKIERLLAKGEDINCRNKYEWTPLIYAIRPRQTEAALLLIERGADVKLQARWSQGGEPPELESAIIWAAMQGDLPVLRQLIAAGADVDTRDGEGRTPAMFAANRGFIELLQALIDARCDLNLQENKGHTALMHADPERLDILELLLKSGADPKIRNKAGLTAAEGPFLYTAALPFGERRRSSCGNTKVDDGAVPITKAQRDEILQPGRSAAQAWDPAGATKSTAVPPKTAVPSRRRCTLIRQLHPMLFPQL